MPVVWDFDYSLIPGANSDTWIPARLHPPTTAFIDSGSARGMQWTALMDAALGQLHSAGIGAEAIGAAAAQLPSSEPIVAAIQQLHAWGVQQFILSDANSVYIERYLAAHGLAGCMAAVRTNPARVEASGRMRVAPYHSPAPACPRCPVNLCKGKVLVEELRPLAAAAAASTAAAAAQAPAAAAGGSSAGTTTTSSSSDKWVYIGDGGGDACPCLRLGPHDVILARAGWELHKVLKKEAPAARVVPWGSGKALAEALLKEWAPA